MSKKIIVLVGVVLLLGLVIAACVPGSVQQAISQTSADLQGLKGDVKKLGDKVDALSKSVQEPEITQAERDIKEHVVRGRADFIGFQENYNKFSKSTAKNLTTLLGTPAKVVKGTKVAAKPGLIQKVDKKLDALLGTPARKAVPAKEDPKTGKMIKAKPAVPAKPGLLDKVNDRLDALLGIPGKPAIPEKTKVVKGKTAVIPGKPAVPPKPGLMDKINDRLDALLGITGKPAIPEKTKVVKGKTVVIPGKPAIPPKPGLIDDVKKDIADIKARMERIESKLGIVAPAAR